MSPLEHILDERDADRLRSAHQSGRDAEIIDWLHRGGPPEVRLLKFDSWIRRELASRIDWAWAGSDRARRIEQARVYLERLVLELWRRGWMLDGRRLADHLIRCLDAMNAYQRAGKVRDFWPYFRACVDRYVGLNAEEIRQEAMSAGAHASQVLAQLLRKAPNEGPAMTELLTKRAQEVGEAKDETLREKLARARAKKAACEADARQPQLFDSGASGG